MPVSLGLWSIDARVSLTLDAFEAIESGSPEACGCDPCLKFAASRRKTYPKEFRQFLRELGVPYDRESEIYHNCRLKNGLHSYGGWFHCLGQIVDGPDAFVPLDENGGTYNLRLLNDTFSFGITTRTALVPDSLSDGSVLQIQFATEIPWVITATPVA